MPSDHGHHRHASRLPARPAGPISLREHGLPRALERLATALLGSDADDAIKHFHLSEFCRYAIESRAYPELSASLESGLNTGVYTFEEVRALVAAAKLRGVRVVPEYDIPGHQARNMGSIDELVWCGARPPNAATGGYQWELYDDPANKTRRVLTKLFGELVSLFPDKYFHIGGDETAPVGPYAQRESNPHCSRACRRGLTVRTRAPGAPRTARCSRSSAA